MFLLKENQFTPQHPLYGGHIWYTDAVYFHKKEMRKMEDYVRYAFILYFFFFLVILVIVLNSNHSGMTLTQPGEWHGISPAGIRRSALPPPFLHTWTSSPDISQSGWSCRWWPCRRFRTLLRGCSRAGSSLGESGCLPVDKKDNKSTAYSVYIYIWILVTPTLYSRL